MTQRDHRSEFLIALQHSLADGRFTKLSLAGYHGTEDLKAIHVRRVLIKNHDHLSFTYRFKTRDVVKNFIFGEGLLLIKNHLENDFHAATLWTQDADYSLQIPSGQKASLKKLPPSQQSPDSLEHNHSKQRLIKARGKPYLAALGLTDEAGKVYAHAQDKYRQINKYIEIVSANIKHLPPEKLANIVDMGCGKGYLTFALYDYLVNTHGITPKIEGVEFRQELVDSCNAIAESSGFTSLHFKQGSISQYRNHPINILIALHACDSATDDAIYQGIKAQSELIIVAPCCQKQIRQQMEQHDQHEAITALVRHGILMERMAEMVTDSMRALILEYHGYSTKVFEFISDAHTAKNIMIIGTKTQNTHQKREKSLHSLHEIKRMVGIDTHYLETMLGMEK